MADLSERLERRGATDENIWKWCDCILAHAKKIQKIREVMRSTLAFIKHFKKNTQIDLFYCVRSY